MTAKSIGSRIVERFTRYVECASESRSERNFCELIEAELTAIGMNVTRDEVGEKCGSNGWNIFATLDGEGEPLLLSAHMDTVSPGVGIKVVNDAGILRSKGDTVLGADDKAAIAIIVEAILTLKENGINHRPIEILLTVCEEIGILGAKFADYSKIKSKQALVLDSGDMESIISSSPANIQIHFDITGKSAHAGVAPDQGIHALKAAADAISKISVGFVDEKTVMNVANFLAPGKTNIVPEKAQFDMEIRSFDSDLLQRHLDACEKAVRDACSQYGATYKMDVETISGVLYVPESSPLITKLMDIYSKVGIAAKLGKSYGGCDATWLFANGIDAVNIGVGMNDPHSTSEHIAIADMITTADVVKMMLEA